MKYAGSDDFVLRSCEKMARTRGEKRAWVGLYGTAEWGGRGGLAANAESREA